MPLRATGYHAIGTQARASHGGPDTPMETLEIIARRLDTQGLLRTRFASPQEVVRWQLAVQAQDYAGAKWSLGQRLDGVTDAALDALFDAGAILRTHVMRPTWHFVLPEDLRWLLALTAPRVHAANRGRYRELGLDEATLERGREAIERAIADAGPLTRQGLAGPLAAAGIDPAGQRLAYLAMYAELEAAIVSGPRQGKQHTYALFDERVPPAPPRDRDAMLAELVARYVASHGPAPARDVAWWSGLTVRDVRRGLALAGDRLACVEIDGTEWWHAPGEAPAWPDEPLVHLLQPWDEYALNFRAHNPVWSPAALGMQHPKGALWNANLVVVDGRVAGGWRRLLTPREARITPILPEPLGAAHRSALAREVERYGDFLGLPVVLEGGG